MKRHLPYDRSRRLADQIYRRISEVCYTELSDPRLEGVQLTGVRLTKDLRIARIYFHVMDADDGKIKAVKSALQSASGFFKRAIGEEVQLKFMPELEYFYDETEDVRERIDKIFEDLANKDVVED
jgi:ribosome-binding factor A